MNSIIKTIIFVSLSLGVYSQPLATGKAIEKPIAIDSRIKTYIFSENEVFKVVVHYGYQTSIEFAEGEEIQTISAGNNYAWQLTPVGRRLFIKPLEENIATNMTILTNKQSYHFDVESRLLSYANDEELVYVIRFFYPDKDFDSSYSSISAIEHDPIPVIKPYNYNYTITGPDNLAPIKIFDDGINTFFKFKSNEAALPYFSGIDQDDSVDLIPRRKGEYIVVNAIYGSFKLNFGKNRIVRVYNESLVPKR